MKNNEIKIYIHRNSLAIVRRLFVVSSRSRNKLLLKIPHSLFSITYSYSTIFLNCINLFFCAVQKALCRFEQKDAIPKPGGMWCFLVFFLMSGCTSKSSNNIPVVRLPTQVKYSLDPHYYFVQPGDTLYSIAWRQNLDYRFLAIKNHIREPYIIHVGEKLKVQFHGQSQLFDSPSTNTKPRKSKLSRTKFYPEVKEAITSTPTIKNKPELENNENNLKKSVTKWIWPVKGIVVETFSDSRGGNKGIDINTEKPMPVKAIADGKVVYSGQGIRGYGRLVIIKHTDDYLSAYAYNSRILVAEQDNVKAGQLIADTGLDGLEKNKLHLEIRYRGKPVDPMTYLKED